MSRKFAIRPLCMIVCLPKIKGWLFTRVTAVAVAETDVGEDCQCASLATDTVEICVVGCRFVVFVDCWSRTLRLGDEGFAGRGVPCDSEAIDIVETVAKVDF